MRAGNKMESIASIVFVLVFILFSIHLFVKYCHRRNHVVITVHRARPTPPTAAAAGGLDAAAIASLPTFVNRVGSLTNVCKEECAVCLSMAVEGEMMRLLPECKHAFHIECIDMWLHSHPTCPICRTRAKPMTKSEFGELLAAPPLPERFGHDGRVVQEGGSESESSQISRMGNDLRRCLSTVGAVDLERQ